ncbi:MAG: J domain-containing protein [Betaproteobacteria bacterium]
MQAYPHHHAVDPCMSLSRRKLVTHYDNLKVASNAPDVVIRAAYRVLVQQNHPDKFPDRAVAEHRIKIINKAYEVLSDPGRRKAHDEWIAAQSAHSARIEAKASVGEPNKNRAGVKASLHKTTGQLTWRSRLDGWGRRAERIALGIALVLLVWLLCVDTQIIPRL